MDWFQYEKTIFWRAWYRTTKWISELFRWGHLVSLSIQFMLSLLVLVFVLGETTQAQGEFLWALAMVSAIVLMIPLRFVWAYIAEPAHLYDEARARIDQLELEKNPKPIFEIWDKRDSMTIREAAYLWCGREPKDSEDPPSDVYYRISDLRRAAVHDELNIKMNGAVAASLTFFGKQLENYPETKFVTRDDLIDYAEFKGERPPFLFPEERNA